MKYDIRQIYPQTSAITNARPGVSGAATGQTTFQWQDDMLWWVPSLSYFNTRGHFLSSTGTALPRQTLPEIAYVDNWVSAMFSQVQIFCNSQSVEQLQNPPQADTACLYSSVDQTWLRSFGSASGVGEALTTRQLNSQQFGTAAPSANNYNEVVASWRPAISLFDTAHGIPPGAQWRVDLSWANNAEQLIIESMATALAGTDYTFVLDEFTFYKATLQPDISVPKPLGGYIELNPVQVNVYPLTGGNTLQVNVPLPATANRLLVCFQDNNSANSLAAGQNGLKPITSFAASFSSGATDLTSYIQNLYVSFPELGVQFPNPTYSLVNNKSEWQRAYADWIAICRGASGGYEGSVPFGTFDTGIGAAVLAPAASTARMTIGDPNNYQQNWTVTPATGAIANAFGNQTALWGWLGRCPGPIFAVPVVRPPDKLITNANLSLTLSSAVTSINVFVISSFSMGIACEQAPDGRYAFEIMRGL